MLKNRSHELSRQLAADIHNIHMYSIMHKIYLLSYINIIQLYNIGTCKITC